MMDLGLNWRSGWSNRFNASVVPRHEDCLVCSLGIWQTEVKVHKYNARVILRRISKENSLNQRFSIFSSCCDTLKEWRPHTRHTLRACQNVNEMKLSKGKWTTLLIIKYCYTVYRWITISVSNTYTSSGFIKGEMGDWHNSQSLSIREQTVGRHVHFATNNTRFRPCVRPDCWAIDSATTALVFS